MKFIPEGVSRKIAEQGLLASEKAPKVLFVGGVIGMVGSTVLACRATLKMETVLDEIELEKKKQQAAKDYVDSGRAQEGTTYSDEELKQDTRLILFHGGVKIVKLYAPSVVLGGVSIFALTKSHNILRDRNVALTAAYTAVHGAYQRYRERVIERYGTDVDRELRYETEQVDVVDEQTGKVITTTEIVGAPGSAYGRWFDTESSPNWSRDPETNMIFLRTVQNYCNDLLRSRGHLFLNEVYTELGMAHTRPGSIVGWRWNQNSGDDYVDFIMIESGDVDGFYNGRDGAIFLDFNVDGVIWDAIEEHYQ